MKAATIVPTAYLDMVREDDYHMCLAHLIGEDEEYTAFYKEMGSMAGKYLIMDNGVIEGNPRPIEEIVRKALMVGADEVVLPDVFRDMEATLNLSYEALRYVKLDFPQLKVMVVPQGNTIEEWMDCAMAMLDWDIDCIGIPKVLVHLGGRDGRLDVLERLGNRLRGLEIHLLGCWQTPLEILYIDRHVKSERILPVRGVDSAIAYVYSRGGALITDMDRPDSMAINFEDDKIDRDLLERNIHAWKEACELGTGELFSIL